MPVCPVAATVRLRRPPSQLRSVHVACVVRPPEEMNPASPRIRCFWLSLTSSITTTLESSAESRGTSTLASRMMSMSVSAWRPCSTARASYQSPGSTGI